MNEQAEKGGVNPDFKRTINGLELKMGEDVMVLIPPRDKKSKPSVYLSQPNPKNKWKRKINKNPDLSLLREFAMTAQEQLPDDERTQMLVGIYEERNARESKEE